jgi:hypothetical protein
MIEYTGPLVSNVEVETRRGKCLFGIKTKQSVDSSPRGKHFPLQQPSVCAERRIICFRQTGVGLVEEGNSGGEEITMDYGRAYFDDNMLPADCRCKKCVVK